MRDMTSTTLRLNMPQWQGGNEPAYRFGAELLAFLAPPADGPEETIDVPYPEEGPRSAGADALAGTSQPVLDWIAAQTITHLAVHLDLDVLDPAHFRPLLFNKPSIPEDAFEGILQGRMRLDQVVRLLNDVAGATDVVGPSHCGASLGAYQKGTS